MTQATIKTSEATANKGYNEYYNCRCGALNKIQGSISTCTCGAIRKTIG